MAQDATRGETTTAPRRTIAELTRPVKKKTRRRWLRRVLAAAAATLLVALVVVAWLPKPIPVETATADVGPLRVTVDETAKTRVKDRYVMSAPLAGNLARIELHAGDTVKAGDVLARIAPLEAPLLDARSRAEAEARVASASAAALQSRSAITRAEIAAAHAKKELEDDRTLVAKGAISAQVLETQELEERVRAEDLVSARFASQVANHELDLARAALARVRGGPSAEQLLLTAPVGGRVLKVIHEDAGAVLPGTQLLEIGDPSALEIVSDVLTTDAVRIRPGARVALVRWGGEPLSGHVRTVEPQAFTRVSALGVEEQRVHVIIDFDDPRDRWAALGDGYSLDAHIVVWEQPKVLTVPQGAAFRREDAWAVFAIAGGRAHLRKITIGQRGSTELQVLTGLAAGEKVIVHPSERLADGDRVTIRQLGP